MSYLYPIDAQGQKEFKLSLIKEIFQQLKFISDKLRPLKKSIPGSYQRIVVNARRSAWRYAYGDIFDELYDIDAWRLETLNKSLSYMVNDTAKQRQQSITA